MTNSEPQVEGAVPDNPASETPGVTASGLPIPPRKIAHNARSSEQWEGRTDEYRAIRAAERCARHRARQENPNYREWLQRRRQVRKNLRRPGWWRPNEIIERLENGERISAIVDQAVKDCGHRVKIRVLYRDLQQWKKKFAQFAEDYARAQELFSDGPLPQELWDDFFVTMVSFDGKVEHACAALGIGKNVIYGMIDPAIPKFYSKAFSERFRAAEAGRYGEIREKFFAKAERGDGDAKVQAMLLESGMPHLHSKKVNVQVDGSINHRLTAAGQAQQDQEARALFRGREPRALPAAPEPVTIDVTAQVAVEEAS